MNRINRLVVHPDLNSEIVQTFLKNLNHHFHVQSISVDLGVYDTGVSLGDLVDVVDSVDVKFESMSGTVRLKTIDQLIQLYTINPTDEELREKLNDDEGSFPRIQIVKARISCEEMMVTLGLSNVVIELKGAMDAPLVERMLQGLNHEVSWKNGGIVVREMKVPAVNVPFSDLDLDSMKEKDQTEERFAQELRNEGHTCVSELECYPRKVMWCQKPQCSVPQIVAETDRVLGYCGDCSLTPGDIDRAAEAFQQRCRNRESRPNVVDVGAGGLTPSAFQAFRDLPSDDDDEESDGENATDGCQCRPEWCDYVGSSNVISCSHCHAAQVGQLHTKLVKLIRCRNRERKRQAFRDLGEDE